MDTNEDELYDSLDWLLSRQAAIEKKLAKRHLQQGSLVLYDLTSTWVEGRSCPLAELGYSRDGKKNKLQVVFGLLCERDGRPVGVEVFEGNTGDPATLGSQIRKVRERFELDSIVFVGDRGMITEARIREEPRPEEEELHTIWLKMGKPDRKVNDEFDRIIRNARTLKIKVARLVYKTADTIKPKPTCWLWDGWIPLQAITLIAGVEGLGKSTYALHLAARLTRGQLAGEYFGKPVNVSLYTTEDDPHSIIVPRLMAAGADMKRVAFIEGKQKGEKLVGPISIEQDVGLLKLTS